MKIKTDDLILGQAERNNPILLTLCRNWQKGANTEVDPVSGVRKLYTFWIITLTVVLITEVSIMLINFVVLSISERFSNHSAGAAFVNVCLATAIFFFVSGLLQRRREYRRNGEFLDAIHFIESIKEVERLVQFPFTSWQLNEVEYGVRVRFIDKARTIDWLRSIPWQAQRAEAEFEEWKKLHASMRRLFPGLPEDYREYFPKHEKVEIAEVAQK